MGAQSAEGFAQAVEEGLVSRRQALIWHLTANHYPRIHPSFVGPLEAALNAIPDNPDLLITLPNGLERSAEQIVTGLHAWHFVPEEEQ